MKLIKTDNSSRKKYIKALIFGTITALIISAVLLALSAVCLTKVGIVPTDYLWLMIVIILALGSFVGGFVSAIILKSNGLFIGLLTGIIVCLFIIIAGALKTSDSFTTYSIYKAMAIIVCSVLGGIIGVNKKEKIKIK